MLDELQKLVKILEKNEIQYCLIGGMAVLLYGGRASTIDFDFYILSNEKEKILEILTPFISKLQKLGDSQYKFKFKAIPVDLLIADEFLGEQVIRRAKKKTFVGVKVKVATPEDLILLKKVADRSIDQRDISELEEIFSDTLDRKYIQKEWKRIQSLI